MFLLSYPDYDGERHGKLTLSWKSHKSRSVATTSTSKLNALYTLLAPGTPLTSEDLAALGISADLAVHYARAGWLTRLARGVYGRPNDATALHPSLLLLQRRIEGLHVGGKSALHWYGVRQYVLQQPALHLYGWKAARLPEWFTERFPADYHRKRLFDERSESMLHVGSFEKRKGAPQVSAPERALLIMLSEVGVRQPLQEACELVESTCSLRADVLRKLLQHCTSVKTVRLCLQLGREASLPWIAKLDPATLPTGSDRSVQVKVEVNFVMRGTVQPVCRASLTSAARDILLADLEIPVVSLEDVYGGKLVAHWIGSTRATCST